jgi:DNA-binding NarL/FixJ family response regulator
MFSRQLLDAFHHGPMSHPIQILIVDDHFTVRKSLSRALDSLEDFEVVGMAPDGQAAVEMAKALKPDIVLMDYAMPVLNGAEATRRILRTNPATVVIGLSIHEEGPAPEEMRNAGASAYILKSSGFGDLVSAIRNHAGQSDPE